MINAGYVSKTSFSIVFTAWNADFKIYDYAFLSRCIFLFRMVAYSLLNNISLVNIHMQSVSLTFYIPVT